MTRRWLRYGTALAVMILPAVLAPLGCGSPQVAGGCSVNGTYYPNGNAPGGQCVCPPIGSCTISWPGFVPTQVAGRTGNTITVLSADAILITGGRNPQGEAFHTAVLYDPATHALSPITSRMTIARAGHAATLLPDGEVLLTGGRDGSGAALDAAELYDPASQSFAPLSSRMLSPRSEHTATLLPDGTVLIAGGQAGSLALNSAEIFDPITKTFAPLAARMAAPRSAHDAMLLPSGDVLLSGGHSAKGPDAPAAETYDPWARTFAASARR